MEVNESSIQKGNWFNKMAASSRHSADIKNLVSHVSHHWQCSMEQEIHLLVEVSWVGRTQYLWIWHTLWCYEDVLNCSEICSSQEMRTHSSDMRNCKEVRKMLRMKKVCLRQSYFEKISKGGSNGKYLRVLYTSRLIIGRVLSYQRQTVRSQLLVVTAI